LRPLSAWRAKPLLPIGDRPAVAHIVERVRALGGPIVVNAHHRVGDVRDFAEPLGIAVSEEADLLGTAGGLAQARPLFAGEDVVVWNGDILIDLDAAALVRAHAASGAAATLAIAPAARGRGNTGVDAAGDVARLRDVTARAGEVRGGDFVGVYAVSASLLAHFPARGGLIEDVLLPAIGGGARVATHEAPRAFFDIGTPAQYLAANVAWLKARGEEAWCGEGSRVDVALVASVVGAGARVEGSGVLERCVVWPGAVARAPLANAIVAAEGMVVAG